MFIEQGRPIITFTANLAAETTYYVDDWGPGQTSRATRERFQVGGKGINVSKMLKRLQAQTTAVCFPGGNFGNNCKSWLNEHEIPYKAFTRHCITRSGSIIRTRGKEEISILGLDCHVSQAAVEQCMEYLSSLEGPCIITICGVIPDWPSASWQPLRDWISSRESRFDLAIDTYGKGLRWFAKQSPSLIKINRDELVTLFDEDVSMIDTASLLERIAKLYSSGTWIVTDGSSPIFFRCPQGTVYSFQPRAAHCISPIGCGDIFFATYLHCIYNKSLNPKSAVALAAEYASRNAESEGIADFSLEVEPN
tara:strand:+ start:228 stop:1151 length:924 start_codon:yes stop_codon:yes gene_type:complete